MEEMYGAPSSTAEYSDKALMTPENLIFPADYQSFLMSSSAAPFRDRIPMFGSDELLSAASAINEAETSVAAPDFRLQEDSSSVIKARIASHPHYPRLLQAYLDCQKVNRFLLFFLFFWFHFYVLVVLEKSSKRKTKPNENKAEQLLLIISTSLRI